MRHVAPVSVPAKAAKLTHDLEFIKENLPQSVIELVELVALHVDKRR